MTKPTCPNGPIEDCENEGCTHFMTDEPITEHTMDNEPIKSGGRNIGHRTDKAVPGKKQITERLYWNGI